MVLENDPSARIKVISVGMLQHPGACAVCGSGNCDAGYVDLGVYFDYEGNVYLCVTCAKQIGETVGLFTPEEVKHVQEIADKLAVENEELKKELEHARPFMAAISSIVTNVSSDGRLLDHTVGLTLEDVQDAAAVAAQSANGPADGEPVTEEPTVSVRRPRKSGASKLRNTSFD